MLGLDVRIGSEIHPGLLGILVGHTYYFLSVLHPLATGKNYLKTPMWVYPFLYGFMAKAFQSMFNSYYYYIFDGTRSMVP
jgi:hypothetical protein